ncbi:MAG: hypothetical protein H6999_06315 [Hahellaceae bacterium]|nr:hypothetical protein [Hahellaceae bacterium]MCP5169356.1 hypothetical protein [Hahellaceae bacterium]
MLACALAQPVAADLKPLSNETLGSVTGQAGITVELETKVNVGEFRYRDDGFLFARNIALGDADGSALDNLQLTMDIAGDNEVLHHGFSKMAMWADQGLLDSNNADVAYAISQYQQGANFGKTFNNGDLVIHLDALNPGIINGGNQADNLNAARTAIDFGLNIDAVGLTDSGYSTGSATQQTLMFENIRMQGYLGPTDLVIRNAGNAQGTTLANGMTVGDSRLEFDTHFEVSDLDFDWNVGDLILLFNFAGIQLENMRIHNSRGNDTLGHFGYASATAKIAQGTSAGTGKSGMAIYDVEAHMDIDMPIVRIGGISIGQVDFTDFVISNTTMLVYGHP